MSDTQIAASDEKCSDDDHLPTPPLTLALLPVLILVALLTLNVIVFKDDAVSGSNQIILIFSAALAAVLSMLLGKSWKSLEQGIVHGIRLATPAILILLMVGALSGAWLVSGIIPTMIYYGLHLLSPSVFLVAACIICIFVSLFTGSSWTTAATVGIALIGIGKVLGLDPGMIAGAIISGAYFGDKLSPLSDTTNLASASTGTELFEHIRYMCFTTVPSIAISLLLFLLMGFNIEAAETPNTIAPILSSLRENVNLSPVLMVVPCAVIFMIVKKTPAMPALFIGTCLGIVFALIFQREILLAVAEESGVEGYAYYVGAMISVFGDSAIVTGHATLDDLLSSGGMAGMLSTIWLIVSAMIFGGVMERSGFLKVITDALIRNVKSLVGLVSSTVGTCLFVNVSASDQYLAVLLPGRMFASAYSERGLASKNLSRSIEDSGTVTSVLVPWNTCGAYHAGVLGVATLSFDSGQGYGYAPFAFFCLISPLMSILFAALNIRIARLDNKEHNELELSNAEQTA